jgi:X-X-X-Leu-X-X-Gly heptad repeat protein
MRPGLRVRQAVNLANGSTLAGLGAAVVGGARLARSVDGLVTATGYRLPVPPAPAFCLGNVILTRGDDIDPAGPLFRHEARHATQYAWSGGVAMVPLYLMAAGASWALTGDFGARNIFERLAGLADGGYTDKPMRPGLQRIQAGLGQMQAGLGQMQAGLGRISGSGRPAAAPGRRPRGPVSAARAGSSASPSR